MKRLDSIDVMRALAIIFMIMCHFPIYLSAGEGSDAMLYFFSNHVVGDFAAPFFLFLVGINQALSAQKFSSTSSNRKAFIRGTFILFFGLLLGLVLYGPKGLIEWDILPLIGITTILLIPCKRLPSWSIAFICLIIFLSTPWLRGFTDYLQFWGGQFEEVTQMPGRMLLDPTENYTAVWTMKDITLGLLLVGYFPIFPWIIFPLVGTIVGRQVSTNNISSTLPVLFLLGLLFGVIGTGTAWLAGRYFPENSLLIDIIAPFSFYPNTGSMLLLQLGLCLLLFAGLWRVFEMQRDGSGSTIATAGPFWLSYSRRLGRYSLTVYALHFTLIMWPLWIVKWTQGTFYMENAMGTLPAFLLSLVLLILLHPILYFWDRKRSKYSLEWWLAKTVNSLSSIPLPGLWKPLPKAPRLQSQERN